MSKYIYKQIHRYPRLKKYPRFKSWKRGDPCICGGTAKIYVERYKWRGFCCDKCYYDYRRIVGPPLPSTIKRKP